MAKNGKKAVLVPAVTSMRDYLLKHHKGAILRSINTAILDGSLQSLQGRICLPVQNSDCDYEDMSICQQDKDTVLVVLHIRIFDRNDPIRTKASVFCEMSVDMADDMKLISIYADHDYNLRAHTGIKLSNYLVPILKRAEIDKLAEEVLREYDPYAFANTFSWSPIRLASQMGLTIQQLPLYEKEKTRCILYFCESTVVTAKLDEYKKEYGEQHEVTVPAGTIVVNSNVAPLSDCDMDIYHECIHFAWHRNFFRLQNMHNNDVRSIKKKKKLVVEGKEPSNPVKWLEWQARRGAYALMLPRSIMEKEMADYSEVADRFAANSGDYYERIGRHIASTYLWPKFRIRARMIQLGHILARGALNYVDDHYIKPFSFDPENGDMKYSFVIDRENLSKLCRKEKELNYMLCTGKYLHVDGHVCVNDPEYVAYDDEGAYLTEWALDHIDCCCLRFVSVYEETEDSDYEFCCLRSDIEYNRHYYGWEGDKVEPTKEDLDRMFKADMDMGADVPGILKSLMAQRGISVKDIADETYISVGTINNLISKQRSSYDIEQLVSLCLAIHINSDQAQLLLDAAGIHLNFRNRRHYLYRRLLSTRFMDSFDDIQEFLVSIGEEPLKPSRTTDLSIWGYNIKEQPPVPVPVT